MMKKTEEKKLPKRLYFNEEGYWHTPYGNHHPDAEEWISTGFRARDYGGNLFYRHGEEAKVKEWLDENGYEDTGNGHIYQRG